MIDAPKGRRFVAKINGELTVMKWSETWGGYTDLVSGRLYSPDEVRFGLFIEVKDD